MIQKSCPLIIEAAYATVPLYKYMPYAKHMAYISLYGITAVSGQSYCAVVLLYSILFSPCLLPDALRLFFTQEVLSAGGTSSLMLKKDYSFRSTHFYIFYARKIILSSCSFLVSGCIFVCKVL